MDINLGRQIAQQTVYLMGISFMLGSLFTIFVLIILDMLRAARENSSASIDIYAEENEEDSRAKD
jgi:hypothetical protein